jgi:hypothetical protein
MKMMRLRGWGLHVEKESIPGEDDVWTLVFTEKMPPTGDEIRFEMNRETRDGVVRGLTDGIVLAGGDLPKL